MYNHSLSPDLITILAGILSVILIITFFVIAFRIKKIMKYLEISNRIILSKAKKEGLLEITCPSCDRLNYIPGDERPAFCIKCGLKLTDSIEKLQASQTDKTDKS
jgi:phage FluMu protein Com